MEQEVDRELLDKVKYLLQNMPFVLYTGIVLDELEMDHATAHVDLCRRLANPYGMAHGGIIFTLVDVMGGMVARADGRQHVTLNSSINYIHGAAKGRLCGYAVPVKRGRTTTVVDARITDEEGHLIATATTTMFCTGMSGPAPMMLGLEDEPVDPPDGGAPVPDGGMSSPADQKPADG